VKRIGFSRLRKVVGVALLCLSLLAGRARAQQPAGSGTQSGATTATSPTPATEKDGGSAPTTAPSPAPQRPPAASDHTPTLAQFSWLEGQWRGEWGSRVAEQTWLGPQAGEVAGVFRLVESEKTLVLELFSLVEKPEGVQFYLRHFTPELLPWEKSDPTLLKLESLDAKSATFVNPVNGEPKRTILTRVDADTYTARSEIEPEKAEPQVIEITFHRQKPPAAAPSAGSGAHQKKP
jgi:hypothetical protein